MSQSDIIKSATNFLVESICKDEIFQEANFEHFLQQDLNYLENLAIWLECIKKAKPAKGEDGLIILGKVIEVS